MTPEEISLWIVAFRRRAALTETIRGWLESFPFEQVNVIVNDPGYDYSEIGLAYPQVMWWPNVFRERWETGSIAWCWNQCMRHTFEHHKWCLMSQDDVIIRPGWDELITDRYDTYIAPVGDTIQLQSLDGFNVMGWFDERFRAIGGPESDYLLRGMQVMPDRLSVHDEHMWNLFHNDVGLAGYWQGAEKAGEILETRQNFNVPFAGSECFARWEQKWGVGVDELFNARKWATERRPGWDEIDWYPAFTRRLEQLGRRGT